MRRKFTWLAAVFGGLLTSAANAAEPTTAAAPVPLTITLPAGQPGVACPPGQATTIILQGPVTVINGEMPQQQGKEKHRVGSRIVQGVVRVVSDPVHRCEPDGCPTPVGCSNPFTEFKFVFGSCTQFFGSGDATRGACYNTRVPPRQPGSPHP
jgi:hypothetical protein